MKHPNGPKWERAKRGILYTYSGRVAYPEGAPTLQDIGVSLSREGRYAGAGLRWWPVMLHTFVVCDLLPKPLKLHGLLHDSGECITGDIPKPVKTDEIERFEDNVKKVIYKSLGLQRPTKAEWRRVKRADGEALRGEVYTVGTQALQGVYSRYPKAEDLVIKYLEKFPPEECLSPDGRAPIEFLKRFRMYSDWL